MADDADALAAEAPEAADDGFVVTIFAVAGERREFGDQRRDVVEAMRPFRMPRDLRLLPGRQVGIELFECQRRFDLETVDVLGDRYRVAGLLHGAELFDLGFELGNRRSEERRVG